MQRPWNYQSRLRPCFNCGQQYERDSVRCTTCGAKRGVFGIQGDGAPKDKMGYITLKESRSPDFGLLEDSVRDRIVNVFQMSLELMKDWLSEYWLHYKSRVSPAKRPAKGGIDSNASLGDLYRLHLTSSGGKPAIFLILLQEFLTWIISARSFMKILFERPDQLILSHGARHSRKLTFG